MRVDLANQDITAIQADAIIVNLFEGVREPQGATGAVNRALDGLIGTIIEKGDFDGRSHQTQVIYTPQLPTPRVILVGLGKKEEFDIERVRQAAGSAMGACCKTRSRRIATIVHGVGIGGLDAEACAQATVEGSLLAAYRYQTHRTRSEEDMSLPDTLILVEREEDKLPAFTKGLERGQILAEATNYARDLVNAPGNFSNPLQLAESARKLASQGNLTCDILNKDKLEELGMGALLAVGQGSAVPPCMIVLTHRGSDPDQLLSLVGKGITYDSGGINLKSGKNMELMRNDMAGGAAVLGAMQAIDRLKPDVTVMGLIPCAENLPSGHALKPGDVVTAMTGKTIEIISTDAEGRLLLADAVAYAVLQGATHVVDVATLTGAIGIALGEGIYSGMVANNDELVKDLLSAASLSGERFWRLPSDPEYRELNKSSIADIRNVGDGLGGAITAGLFVGEFVADKPWVHLDIAGTCYSKKEGPYQGRGATGVTVRTLTELAVRKAGRAQA